MKAHLQNNKHALIWTPLQKKIFLLVVSLFSLVFALTLVSIYQAAYNQAEREFVTRLNVGKNVFMNEIVIAKKHLDSSVETIAKDWALRSAIGQGEDAESIKSVLFNHGKRIDADIALKIIPDPGRIGPRHINGAAHRWQHLPDRHCDALQAGAAKTPLLPHRGNWWARTPVKGLACGLGAAQLRERCG